MSASIIRLEQENDELRAEVALLREQARIIIAERDEARALLERKWHGESRAFVEGLQ